MLNHISTTTISRAILAPFDYYFRNQCIHEIPVLLRLKYNYMCFPNENGRYELIQFRRWYSMVVLY